MKLGGSVARRQAKCTTQERVIEVVLHVGSGAVPLNSASDVVSAVHRVQHLEITHSLQEGGE